MQEHKKQIAGEAFAVDGHKGPLDSPNRLQVSRVARNREARGAENS
jgi:hypothetical protein